MFDALGGRVLVVPLLSLPGGRTLTLPPFNSANRTHGPLGKVVANRKVVVPVGLRGRPPAELSGGTCGV